MLFWLGLVCIIQLETGTLVPWSSLMVPVLCHGVCGKGHVSTVLIKNSRIVITPMNGRVNPPVGEPPACWGRVFVEISWRLFVKDVNTVSALHSSASKPRCLRGSSLSLRLERPRPNPARIMYHDVCIVSAALGGKAWRCARVTGQLMLVAVLREKVTSHIAKLRNPSTLLKGKDSRRSMDEQNSWVIAVHYTSRRSDNSLPLL